MSERSLSDNIVATARMNGWLVHRDPTWRPTATDPGYPDLTLVRGDTVLFVELKCGKNKLSPEQEAWRDALLAAGARWELWTDVEWQAGAYDTVLGIPQQQWQAHDHGGLRHEHHMRGEHDHRASA